MLKASFDELPPSNDASILTKLSSCKIMPEYLKNSKTFWKY